MFKVSNLINEISVKEIICPHFKALREEFGSKGIHSLLNTLTYLHNWIQSDDSYKGEGLLGGLVFTELNRSTYKIVNRLRSYESGIIYVELKSIECRQIIYIEGRVSAENPVIRTLRYLIKTKSDASYMLKMVSKDEWYFDFAFEKGN